MKCSIRVMTAFIVWSAAGILGGALYLFATPRLEAWLAPVWSTSALKSSLAIAARSHVLDLVLDQGAACPASRRGLVNHR